MYPTAALLGRSVWKGLLPLSTLYTHIPTNTSNLGPHIVPYVSLMTLPIFHLFHYAAYDKSQKTLYAFEDFPIVLEIAGPISGLQAEGRINKLTPS